ncbi:MAG: SDR family oxidoreductase [Nitriliruptoraceae bacterium]|nr:SDR family oxidoreductase [Nitriliruptoraceae bacterium]
MEFEGRRIVIAGAAGGIGSAVARTFAEEGATLVLADLPGDPLDELAAAFAEAGVPATAVATDVRDPGSVAALATRIADDLGGVDVLVNAVGVLRQYRVVDMSPEDFDAIVGVNVRGPYLLIKHLVDLMPAGSAIVNFGSVAGFVGSDGSWAYTMTKGAVSSMTFGLAQELAPRGIRVNAICPGWVDAGFTHHMFTDEAVRAEVEQAAIGSHVLGRMARPEEIAQGVLYLASERRASFVTGTNHFVDGGFMIKR